MTSLAESLPPASLPTPHRAGTWIVLVAVACGTAAAMTSLGPAIAGFLAVVMLGVFSVGFAPEPERRMLLAAYLTALLVRLVAMVMFVWLYRSPFDPFSLHWNDSIGYHRVGTDIAMLMKAGLPFREAYHTTGGGLSYHHVVGHLYAAFGVSHWIPRISNCVLGALTVLATYGFARPLGGRRVAVLSAWLAALWPTAIFWAVHILKDVSVGFLVILCAFLWVRFVVSRRWLYLLLMVPPLIPLYSLRIYTFGFIGVGVYIGLIVLALSKRRFLLATAMVAIVYFGWSVPFVLGLIDAPEVLLFKISLADPFSAGSYVSAIAQGGAGLGVLIPLALVKFLISPLPWKTQGIDNWVVPGILLQYALLPFAFRGGFILLRDRLPHIAPWVTLSILTTALYAVVFLGGNPRHMQMFYPFMFTCGAVGLIGWRHWALPWCLFFFGMIALGLLVMAAPQLPFTR